MSDSVSTSTNSPLQDVDYFCIDGEPLKFSKEVQEAIQQVIQSKDPLDVADFNAVDYINNLFPTEQSLSNIDCVIDEVEAKIQRVDKDISSLVREQSTVDGDGKVALQEARRLIGQLYLQVKDIKVKAETSEEMVREITKDIKHLDCAKHNLTTAITTLNHLHMLVTGVHSLKMQLENRQYGEILMPLQAITEVVTHFSEYHDIPQIVSLASEVKDIQVTLAEQITKDFKQFFSGSDATNPFLSKQIVEACQVASILSDKVREDLLKWFIEQQLAEYTHLFDEGEEVAWIDKLDRRYAWFKKHLLLVEEQFGHFFPVHWELSERLTVQFCRITKAELSKILEKRRNEIDVKLLLFAIQRTKQFESLLGRRCSGVTLRPKNSSRNLKAQNGNVESEQQTEMTQNQCPFDGIISDCFAPYLYVYIKSVDRNLFELMERFSDDTRVAMMKEDVSFQTTPATVLPNCADLFLFYKKSLTQCSELGTPPIVSLSATFKKYLREYAVKILQNNLPKGVTSVPIPAGSSLSNLTRDLREMSLESAAGLIRDFSFKTQTESGSRCSLQELSSVCCILTTAEYCMETTKQLEEKLKEKAAPPLREEINLSDEQDLFHSVISNCIQLLVQDLETCCEPSFVAMEKMQWMNMEAVGDQSGYVNAVVTHLKTIVPLVRTKLSQSRKYFTQFCIKFANSFISKYIFHLYKCKPLSTVGAEQLLLDTHSLKTVLLDLPSICSQVARKSPASYTKIVVKGMHRAEMILKLVMSPTEPEEAFLEQFQKLLPDADVRELHKILEMKGMKFTDRNALANSFQPRNLKFVTGSEMTSPQLDTSSIRKLNNLIKKIPDLRR